MLFYCMRIVLMSISLSFVLSVANAQDKVEESKANQIKVEEIKTAEAKLNEALGNAPEKQKFSGAMILTDIGAFNVAVGIFTPAIKNYVRIGLFAGVTEFVSKESDSKFTRTTRPDYRIQFRMQDRMSEFLIFGTSFDIGVQKFKDGRNIGYFELGSELGANSIEGGFVNIGLAWRGYYTKTSNPIDDSGVLLRPNMLVPRLVFGTYF